MAKGRQDRRGADVALVHVDDARPGLSRRGRAPRFTYADARGRRVADERTIARIRSLAIPPAWTDVWICADARGHLQATGRDAAGRKQYRYHAAWNRLSSRDKFGRMREFGEALPRLRARVARDLARPGLPREKVLALVVRLLELTHARVGNDEYAKAHGSRGLTTLQDSHARDAGRRVVLAFRGKSGVRHEIGIDEPRLVRLVRACRELPGHELFQYVDDRGRVRDVSSGHVNDYIRECSGGEFTAKDFRTWSGTCLAADALLRRAPSRTEAAEKRLVAEVVREVADCLGNRPATCRKHYIHPAVFELHASGRMSPGSTRRPSRLRRVEAVVLDMLRRRER